MRTTVLEVYLAGDMRFAPFLALPARPRVSAQRAS